jgi:radical SAM protein with 4Fe4S-binding SPASM domain
MDELFDLGDVVESTRKISRTNPFRPLYDLCNKENSEWRYKNLPDFPNFVDLELTNTCNFRCLMCPTGNLSQKRASGFMEDDVYYKILGEIKVSKTPIRFIRWGEPTSHPKMVEFIRAAKKDGVMCHLNTNGSLLNEEKIDQLLKIPLDSIKFSFQGVDAKSYREMRNTDFFDGLMSTIKLFFEKRGGQESPFIHISTTITYETKKQVEAFKKMAGEFSDLVTVGRTVLEGRVDIDEVRLGQEEKEMLKYLESKESLIKAHPECPEVFNKLSINWDGTLTACCTDSDNKMLLGNIKESSMAEIWKSNKLDEYRKMLVQMRHDELDLCKNCYDYMSIQTPGLQKT